jgi:UDP-GlcNAc:undecaprenyl-phosphate GlcNAc-1-phosphate transferase
MHESRMTPIRPISPGKQSGPQLMRSWPAGLSFTRAFFLLVGLGILFLISLDPLCGGLRAWAGRWFHVWSIAVLVALVATPLTEWLALRTGAVDRPDRRKIHDRPTPRLGGVAIFAGLMAALVANNIWEPDVVRILFCAGVLFALGVAEDIRGVSARVRLLVQAGLAVFLVVSGITLKLLPQSLPLSGPINGIITVIWIVGITNAFNFFDGMDGLAAGLAILMSGFLGTIAFLTHQPHLGWVSVAVLGGALGFLPYNFKPGRPAEVFMGDGGSTVLGFILACLAVHGVWAVSHPLVNLSPPLLIFGVLIYDMIHTTVSRIARGDVRTFRQWVEYTGRDHLHHRFEALLRSKRRAVFMVLLLTFCLGLAGLIIRHVRLDLALILILQCTVILILVTILERAGNLHERRRVTAVKPETGKAKAEGFRGWQP